MSIACIIASRALRAYCAPRAAAFARALDEVSLSQRRTLQRVTRAVASTGYARSLGLAPADSMEVFRAKVPIADYAALAPWIDAQRGQRLNAIAPGRLRCFEPTSGSAGPVKYVPYNDALLRSFRSLFRIWTHDLLHGTLRLGSGRIFMSVSPQFGAARGLNDDREYLGGALRALIGRFLVAPPRAHQTQDPVEFRDRLATALLACPDLEVMSIWNPGYLLVLLEHIESRRGALLPGLHPARRRLLEADPVCWEAVWPRLQLVSCWTAAGAAAAARILARKLPHALLQGKGLLATEAPITVPLMLAGGCVPLVDEVFLELEDGNGNIALLHEAEAARIYSLIVTQAGGLLRYRLGDRVQVAGRYRGAPLLEFVGRADAVADLVGEKLHEEFVAQALGEVVREGAFGTLLPVATAECLPHYRLLTDDANPGLARVLDAALRRAMRYGEARALGQLGEVEVTFRPDMRRAVHDSLVACGFGAGNIKDRALIPSLAVAGRLCALQAEIQRDAR